MLSKLTTDQIRKEAGEKYPYKTIGGGRVVVHPYMQAAHIEAAIDWAIWKEKAEGLEFALKSISNWEWAAYGRTFDGNHKEVVRHLVEIATKALESFNQNKVK